MYIAMNNFRVKPEKSEEFERAWRERDSFLAGFAGFEEFQLLKGPIDQDGMQRYASHTVWRDEASFRAWVGSDAFKKAHAQGNLKGILAGPPKFMGWTAVDLTS